SHLYYTRHNPQHTHNTFSQMIHRTHITHLFPYTTLFRSNYLLETAKINSSNTINKTHQEIAYELNSSRVVVSRLLKALENEGKVKLSRNSIFISSLPQKKQ